MSCLDFGVGGERKSGVKKYMMEKDKKRGVGVGWW